MNEADVLDIARDGIIVMLKMGGPVMLVALVIGLMISLFQALTQIQEMTLVFVPKIVCVFVALLFFFPFMLSTLSTFTLGIFDKIATLP